MLGGGLRPQFINNTKLLKKGESIFFNIIYLFSIVFNRDNETIVGGGSANKFKAGANFNTFKSFVDWRYKLGGDLIE